MVIKIGEKEFPITFGFAALEFLDKVYTIKTGVGDIGQGLNMLLMYLMDENPLAIRTAIKAGTETLKQKPSNEDIDDFITELAEKEKLDGLFKELLDELKKQPLTKKRARNVVRAIEKASEEEAQA